MWIPLVMVGSLLYWTVALGLGSMSLSFLGDSSEDLALQPAPAVTEEPIIVHLQSEIPGTGGNTSADDGTGRLPATSEDSPAPPAEDSVGRTSY
jgi:hypothetical protein